MFVIRGGSKMKALTVMCNQTELYLWPEYLVCMLSLQIGKGGRLKANYHTARLPLGGTC